MAKVLAVQERDASKKSITRSLRKNGKIPAVLYGKTAQNQPIAVDERDILRVFQEVGRNGVIGLELNGKTYPVITHDIQFDPLKREFVHLDFFEVDMDQKMDVGVPIHFIGEDEAAKAGAVVQHHLNELTVKTLPSEIPSSIELDVSEMAVGDVLKVKDVKSGSGYEILNSDDDVIVSVIPPARDRGEEDLDVKGEIEEEKEEHV
ncbi:MAG: 50S ribosomal protein L25/general stress protein Ctc [Tuberibacillus sp.]